MKLSNELIQKAKKCKSAEEIAVLAKEKGFEIMDEEAAEAFVYLNKNGELADSELNAVSGGVAEYTCNNSGETPKYSVGQKVRFYDLKGAMGLYEYTTGVIINVSEQKVGSEYPEWLYTITRDDNGANTQINEHQISGEI